MRGSSTGRNGRIVRIGAAGGINVITKKPELGNTSGYLTLEAGNYSLLKAEGALNLPITDNSAMRVI